MQYCVKSLVIDWCLGHAGRCILLWSLADLTWLVSKHATRLHLILNRLDAEGKQLPSLRDLSIERW